MSLTNYENNVNHDTVNTLQEIAKGIAPEFLLEILGEQLYELPGKYTRIASAWCMGGTMHICEELPGHPRKKDFPIIARKCADDMVKQLGK